MKALLGALVFAGFFSTAANADVELSGCVMKNMYVKSVNVLLIKKGTGTATIICNGDGPGPAMTREVSIDVSGYGPGIGTFEFYGADIQLGINNPYDIEGRYLVANADFAFGLGAGANFGLRAYKKGGLSFKVGVAGGEGVGVGLTASTWTFTVVD